MAGRTQQRGSGGTVANVSVPAPVTAGESPRRRRGLSAAVQRPSATRHGRHAAVRRVLDFDVGVRLQVWTSDH